MTTPIPGSPTAFPLKTAGDFRLFFYILSPMFVTALVASGALEASVGGLISALVLAILNPVLQAVNSSEKWRTYIYGVLGAINTGAIALGYWSEATFAPWIGVGAMILNTVLAAFFTSTSTDAARSIGKPGRHAKPE